MLAGALKGLTERDSIDSKKNPYPKMGSLKEIAVPHVSFDHEGEVNLHRPYIDALSLKCDRSGCDGTLRRVSDVIDGWFDSGAMPFAQWHYPFDAESRRKIDGKMYFPADFISEGVDQTRGWFYTLLAVSTLLGKGAPYRNVISVGHVLDVKGEAMHKSKGNVIFPQDIIRRFGIDALRWYYFTINSAGEPKRFDEKELMSRERRFLATLWHTFLFYETYVHRKPKETKDKTPLDSWMYLRIKEVSEKIQASLDAYDIPTSARSLDLLLDDISNWYVRRSRIMLQRPASRTEYNRAAWHLQNVLATFVKLSAPFIPLLSEAIYQRLKFSKKESVHCAQYPSFTVSKNEEGELRAMEEVRQIVSLGLAARKKSGIKVRQPLAECVIAGAASGRSMQYERLICDELNVKSATWTSEKPESRHAFACEEAHSLWVGLDTTLNSALKEEGEIREFIRQIQNIRKRHHLRPKERITCGFTHHSSDASFLIEKWKKVIEEETRISLRQADSFRKRGGRREMCRIQDKEIPVIFYIS